MARTIEQIEAEIEAKVATLPELAAITAVSKTSWYGLFKSVVAYAIQTFEALYDLLFARAEELKASAAPGTLPWYRAKALEWQYNDTLLIDENYKPYYAVINPALQFVDVASATEGNGSIALKVAKLSGANYIALNLTELVAFNAFLNAIKMAGTKVNAISQAGDELKVNLQVVYNAQFDGALLSAAIEDAIVAHLDNLQFDGRLYQIRLIDAIQEVPGVIDAFFNSLEYKPFGGSYIQCPRITEAVSGWFKYDDAGSTINITI